MTPTCPEDQTIAFRLHVSADQYKSYYQGQVQMIQVRSNDGRQVRFPASAMRQFVTTDGIHGDFELKFDENNKLIEVVRVSTTK